MAKIDLRASDIYRFNWQAVGKSGTISKYQLLPSGRRRLRTKAVTISASLVVMRRLPKQRVRRAWCAPERSEQRWHDNPSCGKAGAGVGGGRPGAAEPGAAERDDPLWLFNCLRSNCARWSARMSVLRLPRRGFTVLRHGDRPHGLVRRRWAVRAGGVAIYGERELPLCRAKIFLRNFPR